MSIALITKGIISPTIFQIFLSDNVQASLEGCQSCEDCSTPTFKIGNSTTLDFLVSANGVRLTEAQLQAADNIIFAVKQDAQDDNDDAIIFKDLLSGLIILPDMGNDSPNVRVTLTSSDTTVQVGSYPTGLQVNFSDDDIKEASLQLNDVCFSEIFFSLDVIR